jgi:hypothetical protein
MRRVNGLLRAPLSVARQLKRKLSEGDVTFGLPEATILSLLGIAIALLAAYHYTRVGGPAGHG